MASGVDGKIITYDASGNPSAVGPGTDGQVLTSTGAGSPPAFETTVDASILQVKQTVKTEWESISGESGRNAHAFVPGDGGGTFMENITITGSNKVLVNVVVNLSISTSGYTVQWVIMRGAESDDSNACTKIAIGTEVDSSQSSSTGLNSLGVAAHMMQSMMWLDSPGAGTHYYKIAWQAESGSTGYINRSGVNTNAVYQTQTPSTITLFEVSA